jgi:hypothetical protein
VDEPARRRSAKSGELQKPAPKLMKTLPSSVAELQRENVLFELESIDRMYCNAYVPQLTSAAGVASYFRHYKGHRFASTKDAVEMSAAFKRSVLDFAQEERLP